MGTRIDIFNLAHKGLRALLYETAIRIQQNDFTDEHQTTQILDELDKAVDLCLAHTKSELNVLFSFERSEPVSNNNLSGQIERNEKISHDLLNAVATYQYVNNARSRTKTGYRINQLLNQFIALQLELMNSEEKDLNELLWSNYNDDEIISLAQKMQDQLTSEKQASFWRALIRGLNNEEIVEWISMIKEMNPDNSIEELKTIAARELSPDRWNRISEQLEAGNNS